MTYDVILFTGIERQNVITTTRPFGAYKCANELRKAGYSVLVINFTYSFTDENLDLMLRHAVGANTMMLGVSNTYMTKFTKTRTEFLRDTARRYNPNIKTVVGGASVQLHNEYRGADYVILGFADISIVNLANHLRRGEPLRHSQRDLWGYKLITDWDADDFDISSDYFEWHDDDLIMPQEKTLPLEISRGCIFDCKFCNSRLKGKDNGSYIKSIDIIERELRFNWEKYGIYQYRLLDDTFNDNRQKLTDMEAMVKTLPFQPKFWAFIRLDLMTKHPETIQQLVNIGVCSMTFGIETLHQAAGRSIGKGFDPESQVKTINYIKETYGPKVSMFGHFIIGLPHEPMSSVLETKRRLHEGEIRLDSWGFKPLWINRDTSRKWEAAFGLNLQKYGYVDDGITVEEKYVDDRLSVNWRNEHMTYIEAKAEFETAKYGDYGDWEVINLGLPLEVYQRVPYNKNKISFWEKFKHELFLKFQGYVKDYQEFALSHVTGQPVTLPQEQIVNLTGDSKGYT